MDETELRRRAVDLAQTLDGIGANPADPPRRARYLDFLAGAGLDGKTLLDRSNSVLFATGVLRALGLAVPPSLAPAAAVQGILPKLFLHWPLGKLGLPHFTGFKLPGAVKAEVGSPEVAHLVAAPLDLAPLVEAPPLEKHSPGIVGVAHLGFDVLHKGPLSEAHEPIARFVPLPRRDLPEALPAPVVAEPIAEVPASPAMTPAELAAATDRAVAYDARRLVEWARGLGAWIAWDGSTDTAALTPQPGDLVLTGRPGAAGSVLLARKITRGAGIWLESVDGGERDAAGFPVVVARNHVLLDGVDVVLGVKGGGSAPVDVTGWIHLGRLAAGLEAAAVTTPPVVVTPTTPTTPETPTEPDPASPEGVRHAAVEIAKSVVGFSANPRDAESCAHYGDLIAPGESPAMREGMMSMSGCALTAAGIWHLLGFDAPEIAPPYVIGSAISRLKRLADRAGAWVPYAAGALPAPGDVVLVGGVGGGGSEHVYTVTSVTPGDVPAFESVDGGQRDGTFECIVAKRRRWQGNRDIAQLASDPGASSAAGRGVVGWVDVTRVAAFLGGALITEIPVSTPPTPIPTTGTWEDYAAGTGAPTAGAALPGAVLDPIRARRDALPTEPHLYVPKQYPGGHQYTGLADHAHLQYLGDYLTAAAATATPLDQLKIGAFRAFLSREGSTSAINSYDNMIVTWGVGFGGLGLLGEVMDSVATSPPVVSFLHDVGLRWNGDTFDAIDVTTARVVSERKPALEVIRASTSLLTALIEAARGATTRDAVTLAQLTAFMAHSANHAGGDAIATQALFNFVTHLKHWAPSYATKSIPWAVAQLGDPVRSIERDRSLAPLIGRFFFGQARGMHWTPSWIQFQGYVNDMKKDGLDCTADPWFQATEPTDLP